MRASLLAPALVALMITGCSAMPQANSASSPPEPSPTPTVTGGARTIEEVWAKIGCQESDPNNWIKESEEFDDAGDGALEGPVMDRGGECWFKEDENALFWQAADDETMQAFLEYDFPVGEGQVMFRDGLVAAFASTPDVAAWLADHLEVAVAGTEPDPASESLAEPTDCAAYLPGLNQGIFTTTETDPTTIDIPGGVVLPTLPDCAFIVSGGDEPEFYGYWPEEDPRPWIAEQLPRFEAAGYEILSGDREWGGYLIHSQTRIVVNLTMTTHFGSFPMVAYGIQP